MGINTTIAWRYLYGKKSTNAINLITGISVAGMTIGTAALLLILSVFNGFEDLISKLLNSYNPDIKVVPAQGIYLNPDSSQLAAVYAIKSIAAVSQTLEEIVLFDYSGSQEAGMLKGVDKTFQKVTNIDSTIVRGKYQTNDVGLSYAVLGSGMFNKLSVNPSDPLTPVTVYAALKSTGPFSKDYAAMSLYPSGVFTVGSEEDAQVVITDIEAVRSMTKKPSAMTALEIKLEAVSSEDEVVRALKNVFGNTVIIKNRYQQDEAFLKIMNIEKWISYLIACLTLGLISFNLVGALWMIVLDKRKDISVLKSMGFTSANIRKTVITLGILIGLIGLATGLGVASVLYYLQKNFDLVEVPPGFLIDAYPISFRGTDFILVSITVIVLSFLASILPAVRAARISSFVRHE
ncbi:MAG: FtsX-like permease family protein [Saprospiraceae bacterium]|nr:FtsX-like permease family protein [Saprospiraceae bacterium]